jgi:hypothetical protein
MPFIIQLLFYFNGTSPSKVHLPMHLIDGLYVGMVYLKTSLVLIGRARTIVTKRENISSTYRESRGNISENISENSN